MHGNNDKFDLKSVSCLHCGIQKFQQEQKERRKVEKKMADVIRTNKYLHKKNHEDQVMNQLEIREKESESKGKKRVRNIMDL